jgi:SAM-dependent methyltransferase
MSNFKINHQFRYLISEIWKNKSVTRSFLNLRLRQDSLLGKVIDIGGGKNADYIDFMHRCKETTFETFDIKAGAEIDFEKDQLPSANGMYDTVLFLNVMEHIYNYRHIMSEVIRITKPGGKVIGFVPFLMWYHPDHSDYFRYTDEALEKIFIECGVNNFKIEGLSRGPFIAASQMIMQSLPRIVRVPVFAFSYGLDSLFLFLRPGHGSKYVLGYYFVIESQ